MRKKYKEALLSHKKRLNLLEAQVGDVHVESYGSSFYGADNLDRRVKRIEQRHKYIDEERAEQEEIAALNMKQRSRYKKARADDHDHKTALLIAKECCPQ